jgi:hypothetical protein
MSLEDPIVPIPFEDIAYASIATPSGVTSLLILLCLIIVSALISGSEAAFFSLSPKDKEELKTDNSKKNKQVNELLDKPKDLLATILITNNFVNVGIVILSSAIMHDAFEGSSIGGTAQFLIEFTTYYTRSSFTWRGCTKNLRNQARFDLFKIYGETTLLSESNPSHLLD